MANFTSNTYILKQKILFFSNKVSKHLSKPDRKFIADITYGMLVSESCLLTDIVDKLHEPFKKINVVNRLSRHRKKGISSNAARSYLQQVKKWLPNNSVIHINDSDIVKPKGYKFESLGIITFQSMECGADLLGKATFVMDKGYDNNKMFLKLEELKQDYVICLKSNRKLLYHNQWTMPTDLRSRRKGNLKASMFYKGKNHETYLSHIKVQITTSRKDIYLALVYGITEHLMMFAINKEIKSKEDVIQIARIYFSH